NPAARFAGKPAIHLIPRRSRAPSSPSAGRSDAGIAWANDPSGRGCTPIFGGGSASATRPTIVRCARGRRSSTGGIAATTSAALNHSSGGASPAVIGSSLAPGSIPAMSFDTAQSLANLRLERDAILLYDALAGIEKDETRASAFRRIAGNERR